MIFERNTYNETSALLAKSVQVTNFMATKWFLDRESAKYI